MEDNKKETNLEEQLNSITQEIINIKQLQKFILLGMGADPESLKEVLFEQIDLDYIF